MNKKVIISSLIITVVVVCLFWSGMKDSSTYFLTVSEFSEQQGQLLNKGVRVNGDVVPNSIQWNAQELILDFKISDGQHELSVRYNGVAPDTFKDNISVVVEGKFDGKIFQAIQIMTKCPSKYEAEK